MEKLYTIIASSPAAHGVCLFFLPRLHPKSLKLLSEPAPCCRLDEFWRCEPSRCTNTRLRANPSSRFVSGRFTKQSPDHQDNRNILARRRSFSTQALSKP